MNIKKVKKIRKERRRQRNRAKIFGTAEKPRLSVLRSNKYTYVQLIDDRAGRTLVSASTKELKKGTKLNQAELLGKLIAEKAKKTGISSAVFNKGPYLYHGRIKAVAEEARKEGLKI